ncbi:hypothetical protein ABZ438_20235 [Streptomyces sp. NPDC005786]|uniref:hypothetical protein n=1 Tax=unclassified Streptomyces TaxID=2593676 RepID=UPI0033EEE121
MHADDITISTPRGGAQVPRCITSVTGTGKLSDGHSLWVAVEFEAKEGGSRILFSEQAEMNDGTWQADRVDVGGKGQALNSYTLTAVDVDQATNAMLHSTVVDMSFTPDEDTQGPGKDIWRISYAGYPSGAKPVAQVSVTRAEGSDKSCKETRAAAKKP